MVSLFHNPLNSVLCCIIMKLLLFDVDGTLTPARQKITLEMIRMLETCKKEYTLGFVGGSDIKKQYEQLGDAIDLFTYWFPQNGVQAYKNGVKFHDNNMVSTIGEDQYQLLINDCMKDLAAQSLPFKRGTFIEHRTGMINVAPPGRSCSTTQRDLFEAYDKEHNVRSDMVELLRETFPSLTFSIGGQISFDVFPRGWDKRYCLQFLDFEEIHFFGDKTYAGGNDHEIFHDPRVFGNTVTSPADTINLLKTLINNQ